jgi:hypothetical protein
MNITPILFAVNIVLIIANAGILWVNFQTYKRLKKLHEVKPE